MRSSTANSKDKLEATRVLLDNWIAHNTGTDRWRCQHVRFTRYRFQRELMNFQFRLVSQLEVKDWTF